MSRIYRLWFAFTVALGALLATAFSTAAIAYASELWATVLMPLTVIVTLAPATVDVTGIAALGGSTTPVVITASINRGNASQVAVLQPSAFTGNNRIKTASFRFRLDLPAGTDLVQICLTQTGSEEGRSRPFCIPRIVVVAQRLIDLGPVHVGSDGGALGINNRGEVVGAVIAPGGSHHAFRFFRGMESDLGTLGGSTSVAFSVNRLGYAAGVAEVSAGGGHAFLHTARGMQDLGTVGGLTSGAYAINDRAEVVGFSSVAGDQAFHPFRFAAGQMIDLGSPGGNGMARGINNVGQIVGVSLQPGNLNYRAFLYENGGMIDLGTLGGVFSYARAINDHGEIVGFADPGDGTAHAFLYSSGSMADLGTFGFTDSDAYAINDVGQIVGSVRQISGDRLAFLFNRGEFTLLDSLLPADSGWSLTEAFGINDCGSIVGVGYHDGELRAYALAGSQVPLCPGARSLLFPDALE